MNYTIRPLFACCLSLICMATLTSRALAQWTAPTDEELKMTSQAEVPGAPAVYLFREEVTEDKLHMWSVYARIKVLTERGKDFGDVEVKQYNVSGESGYTINDVEGRTIHSDGTIIPFTGKPIDKLIEKGNGYKAMAKVFTLPDVQVGSIIEYRYKLRYDDYVYYIPQWFIQSDLFTRKAHYQWKEMLGAVDAEETGMTANNISWTPMLPKGAEVKMTPIMGGSMDRQQQLLDLNISNIPPMPTEEYMPPIKSFSYRVLFYYNSYRSADEFWNKEGKNWAKARDKFIGPGSKVKDAAKALVAPSDTDEQKLHKLYDAVMQLDNTRFNREHSAAEEKARGLDPAKSTDDIWERKRGTDDQIAMLFVAMARAVGLKAYLMGVTARDSSMFNKNYLTFAQLDDYIAIVNIGGKEAYFDPGQRYCPYGHLSWTHTLVQGLRQTENGSAIGEAPAESYKDGRTQRIAELTLDEHGMATGTVKITWTGAPALTWRHTNLHGDETSFKNDLRAAVERLMPGGTEVKVTSIEHLMDYEQPLTVKFEVKGQVASFTGKRLIIPGDIFEMNSTASFPHEKREIPVYFDYPVMVQDAVKITFPPSLTIESRPAAQELPLARAALYNMSATATPTTVTTFRNLLRAEFVFMPAEYADLRTFYNKLQSKDQEPIVLKAAAQAPAGN